MVPITPGPIFPNLIHTRETVDSCAVDQRMGVAVCTGTGTDVYLVQGDYLVNTLTSGATSYAQSDDEACMTCGVVVDSLHDVAVLSIGTSSGTAYQLLNLTTNTLSSPIAAVPYVSEGFAVDALNDLIISPTSGSSFDLYDISKPSTPAEYTMDLSSQVNHAELDSGAADTTGVTIASAENSGNFVLSNLGHTHLTAGTPGTWAAPTTVQNLPEVANSFQNGGTELAIASGLHQAIIADEDSTNGFGVLQLPTSTLKGAPSIQDYAVAQMPNDPSGTQWSTGSGAHAVTAAVLNASLSAGAVVSGTTKGFAFLLNSGSTYIAAVDLDALLKAPRLSGTHTVEPSYDLLGNNVVVFVSVGG